MDLQAGEHKKPQFLLINPMGEIPAIKDDSFLLSESVAIAKYLAEKYQVNLHWYPTDLEKRARVDQILAWHHTNLRRKVIEIFKDEVILPFMRSQKVEASVLEEHVKDLNKSLVHIQKHILGDQDYLCGDEISLADIFVACELMQTNISGRDVLKDYPKLRQWFDLVRVTLSPIFEEVHSAVYEFRDRVIAGNKEEKREEKVKQMREIRRRESTDPEGEVIKLELDDNLNFKPETEADKSREKQNGAQENDVKENDIKENGTNAKEEGNEATVQVGE